jgi:hypothetical protein
VNSSTTWRTGRWPKQSTTALSAGHSAPRYNSSAKNRLATVLLPLPEGPTMSPICHGSSRSGSSTANDWLAFSASGTSNMPATCCTRNES